jgi:hypothetical protein
VVPELLPTELGPMERGPMERGPVRKEQPRRRLLARGEAAAAVVPEPLGAWCRAEQQGAPPLEGPLEGVLPDFVHQLTALAVKTGCALAMNSPLALSLARAADTPSAGPDAGRGAEAGGAPRGRPVTAADGGLVLIEREVGRHTAWVAFVPLAAFLRQTSTASIAPAASLCRPVDYLRDIGALRPNPFAPPASAPTAASWRSVRLEAVVVGSGGFCAAALFRTRMDTLFPPLVASADEGSSEGAALPASRGGAAVPAWSVTAKSAAVLTGFMQQVISATGTAEPGAPDRVL